MSTPPEPAAPQYFQIWRRQWPDNRCPSAWFRTAHSVSARTDREAQMKVRRKFGSAGFHSMSLVAVPAGLNPNSTHRPMTPEENALIADAWKRHIAIPLNPNR